MLTETAAAVRFASPQLAGYAAGGCEHGVEITRGVDGKPVTRPMCMNLEHYFAAGRDTGMFVPRYAARRRSDVLDEKAVRLTIEPHEAWSMTSVVTLRVVDPVTFEATYEFMFDESLAGFDVLISHYFHIQDEPRLHLDGRWDRPTIGDREHVFYPRTDATAAHTRRHLDDPAGRRDVRRFVDDPTFGLPISPQRVTAPVMISPVGPDHWSLVHVVEPAELVSFSANRCWYAHDFSLVGRDVARGERITCKAWMVYAQIAQPDEALTISRRFVSV